MSKRCRSNHEPKEKLSSELLNQLMSNTPTRSASQTKQKNNEWPNSRTDQPPSDSVLMNLLVSGCDVSAGYICIVPQKAKKVK